MIDSHNDDRSETGRPTEGDETTPAAPRAAPLSSELASTESRVSPVASEGQAEASGVSLGPELKANQLATIEDLIGFAYQQRGKRLNIPGTVVGRIATNSQIGGDGPDPVLAFVVDFLDRDPLLAVPPRVIAFVASARPPIHLRHRLEAAMTVALRRHALFDSRRLREVLDTSPDDLETVLDGLRAAADRVTPERVGVESGALKNSHRKKLYVNATIALTLLLALRDGWTLDAVIEVLYRRLWSDSDDTVDRLAGIGAVADARDVAALATVGRVFERQRRGAERQASDAESEAERARMRAAAADAQVGERDARISGFEARNADLAGEVEVLRARLEVEERSRVHDRSHHVDDFEMLRTRIVRTLDKQVELLSDGLHALRGGSTEVTEEFIDRTITALARELVQLRAQGETG